MTVQTLVFVAPLAGASLFLAYSVSVMIWESSRLFYRAVGRRSELRAATLVSPPVSADDVAPVDHFSGGQRLVMTLQAAWSPPDPFFGRPAAGGALSLRLTPQRDLMSRLRRWLAPQPFDALRTSEMFVYAIQRTPRPCVPLIDARSGSLSVVAVEALAALFMRFADHGRGCNETVNTSAARNVLRVADLPAVFQDGVRRRVSIAGRRGWQRAMAPVLDARMPAPGADASGAYLGEAASAALRAHLAAAHLGPEAVAAGGLGRADDLSLHAFASALSFRLSRDSDGRRQVSEDLLLCAALAQQSVPSSGTPPYSGPQLEAWLGSSPMQWFVSRTRPPSGSGRLLVRGGVCHGQWDWSEAGAEAVRRCHTAVRGPICTSLAANRPTLSTLVVAPPTLIELFAPDLGELWASLCPGPTRPLRLLDFLAAYANRLRAKPHVSVIVGTRREGAVAPLQDVGVWSELRWSGFSRGLRAELLEPVPEAIGGSALRLTPSACGALAAVFACVACASRRQTTQVDVDALPCALTPSELDAWRATLGLPPVRPALLQFAVRCATEAAGEGPPRSAQESGPLDSVVINPLHDWAEEEAAASHAGGVAAATERTVNAQVYAIVASHLYADPARHLRDVLIAHGFTDRLFFDSRGGLMPSPASFRAATERDPSYIACGEVIEALDRLLAQASGALGTMQPRAGAAVQPTSASAVFIPQRLLVALAVTLMLVVFFAMLMLSVARQAAGRVAVLSSGIKALQESLSSIVAETAQHVLSSAAAQVQVAVQWALSQPAAASAQQQAGTAVSGVQAAISEGLAANALLGAALQASGAGGVASESGAGVLAAVATTAQLSSLVQQGLAAALASSTLLLGAISGAPDALAGAANATVAAASAQLLQVLQTGEAQLSQRGIGASAGALGAPPAAVTAIEAALAFVFDPALTTALDAAAASIVPGCAVGVAAGTCAVALAWALMLRAFVRRMALARRGVYPFRVRRITKASRYIGVQAAQAGVVFVFIVVVVWVGVVSATVVLSVPSLSSFLLRQAISILAAVVGATLFIAVAEFLVMNYILAFADTIFFHRLFLVRSGGGGGGGGVPGFLSHSPLSFVARGYMV